jgi:hypothetical protein
MLTRESGFQNITKKRFNPNLVQLKITIGDRVPGQKQPFPKSIALSDRDSAILLAAKVDQPLPDRRTQADRAAAESLALKECARVSLAVKVSY